MMNTEHENRQAQFEAKARDYLNLRGWTIEDTRWTLRLERETPVQGNECLVVRTYKHADEPTEHHYHAEEGGYHIETGNAQDIEDLFDQMQLYIDDHPQQ